MLPAAIVLIVVIFLLAILYSSVRILREYERGVVFTLGRYTGTKGPGLFLLDQRDQQEESRALGAGVAAEREYDPAFVLPQYTHRAVEDCEEEDDDDEDDRGRQHDDVSFLS